MKEGQFTFKMIIPQSVEAKIRHICSIVHDVEWSGVLFYTYTGSMNDGSFIVICKDLHVMDIGSGAYTEYNENPSILEYRIQNELLGENIQEGLIHSHNNMSTFFSGTDADTLVDEGTNSNHFVSLIVNNAGVYTARVTRKLTREMKAVAHIVYQSTDYYNTYGGDKVLINENKQWEEDKEETKVIQEIEYFNLDIQKEEAINPFDELDERLREIKKEKEKSKSTFLPSRNYGSYGSYGNYSKYDTYNKKKYPKEEPKRWGQPNLFSRHNDDLYDDYYDYLYSHQYDDVTFDSYLGNKDKSLKDDDDYDFPLCLTEDATPEVIENLAAQLVSGDLNADSKSFDIKDFVLTMDSLYEKKFGPLIEDHYPNISAEVIDSNNKKLEDWADSMVDFVVYTEDTKLLKSLENKYGHKFTEVDTAEIIAMDLWRYLDKLPKSYVKEQIMDILFKYIPDAATEYYTD